MITFAGVGVRVPGPSERGDRTLLAGIDLSLGERRIAVIGANGSGKSTLLRLINGLILPSSGTVSVDGLDTSSHGAEVRRRVGFVFTDPLSQLVMSTPADDVELSLKGRIRDRRERRAAALAVLARHGLADVADQSVYDLSGGERQLAALAGVLAVEPSVLVADEPTTLLDLRHRDRIRDLLVRLPQQVIFATHDLEFAADAHRVLMVDGGRIVADGRPDEVVGRYLDLMRR